MECINLTGLYNRHLSTFTLLVKVASLEYGKFSHTTSDPILYLASRASFHGHVVTRQDRSEISIMHTILARWSSNYKH
jgi:hypothetical protein